MQELSKPKEIADDNYRYDKHGGKFSSGGENTVGKGEIVHFKQIFPLPTVFIGLVLQKHKNKGLFGKLLRSHLKI